MFIRLSGNLKYTNKKRRNPLWIPSKEKFLVRY